MRTVANRIRLNKTNKMTSAAVRPLRVASMSLAVVESNSSCWSFLLMPSIFFEVSFATLWRGCWEQSSSSELPELASESAQQCKLLLFMAGQRGTMDSMLIVEKKSSERDVWGRWLQAGPAADKHPSSLTATSMLRTFQRQQSKILTP